MEGVESSEVKSSRLVSESEDCCGSVVSCCCVKLVAVALG
jgi:hypothetical protein